MHINVVKRSVFRLFLVGMILLPLGACSTFKFPGVYRIRVIQGNIIDQKDANKLKLGMTKRQVQFVMGTPLIRDTFSPDRWDYFYSLRVGKKLIRTKELTILFENGEAVAFKGNMQPKAEDDTDSAKESPKKSDASDDEEDTEEA